MKTNNVLDLSAFTAAKARGLSESVQSINGNYLLDETNKILSAIQASASRGAQQEWFYRSDKVIVERLTFLGYSVEVFNDQRDGPMMKVKW